jgi:hypothetical protein
MSPVSLNLDSALSGLAHANVTVRGPRVLEAEQGSIKRGLIRRNHLSPEHPIASYPAISAAEQLSFRQ